MELTRILASAVALGALVSVGCSGTQSDSKEPKEVRKDSAVDPEVAKNLGKLSTTDRESAMKQAHCPVSDQPLGSMGVPITVTVEGKDVWLCCMECEADLKANPQKYLDKQN